MTAQLQCAVVHSIGYAQPHIAEKSAQSPAQSKNNESLKSLSSKVLRRTLSRTLPAQCRAENDPPRTLQKSGKVMPSPVALSWLHEHRQQLKAAGWTYRELYRRNKSRGVCWCGLWDKPFFKAYLHDDGVIEMECVIGGRDCIQTARPMPQRPEKTKGGNPN